jgi:hypothetical protein
VAVIKKAIIACIVLGAIEAFGATYYVSTTGSDTTGTGSISSPWATITHASGVVSPGDTVIVENGTYNIPPGGSIGGSPGGDWAISSSGTSGNPITYIAQTKWQAHLVGQGTGDGSTVIGVNGGYNIIENFDITGTDAAGVILATTGTTASFNEAIGNYVHDLVTPCDSNGGGALNTGGGGSYTGISNDSFYGNLIYNIQVPNGCGSVSTNFGIYEAVPYGTVANNIVLNVAGAAIQSWHAASNLIMFGNTVITNEDGIIIGAGNAPGGITNDFSNVQNNITINSSYCGICEDGTTGTHNTYINNEVYNNANNIILQNGNTATGTVTTAPVFVNNTGTPSGNYQQKAGSPGLGSGLSLAGILTDYLGQSRPQSGSTDIGAIIDSFNSGSQMQGLVKAGSSLQ